MRRRESPDHKQRKLAAKAVVVRKALVQGDINTFLGFEFITSNRLNVDGSSHRKVFAWAEDGIKLAVGKDLRTEIGQRADKSYSHQVYVCASFGATRMEEEKVVQILCSE